jgi:ABC-type transport system substrate-binding protein
MKKTLAMLLVVVMVLGLFAGCVGEKPVDTTPSTDSTTAPTTPAAPATYTYDVNLTEFPTLWNPHTYQTNTASSIMSYLTDSLYTFDYNENYDGYALIPSMATADPIDVTAEYVGKYGVEEGEINLVYKITLRDDLCWEDGTPINAHSFVESAKRLLNPAAMNFRADQLYTGEVKIFNAEAYLKQGKTVLVPSDSVHEIYSEDLDADLVFSLAPPTGGNSEISMRTAFGFPASYDAVACAEYLATNYLSGSAFTVETAALMEGKTLAEIKADETMKAAWEALIGWWQTDPNEELDFFLLQQSFPEVDFSEVGIFALSDYELVYALINPSAGFDLKYALPDGYLVHEATYDACESVDENGLYTNTYGTSVETSKSYGPYIMTAFQADKEVRYTRNNDWHGITEDTYQTTDVVIHCVPEASTRLEMLIAGQLDTYGLQTEDMDKYLLSDYTYLSQSASVWGMVFNPNKEALETKQAEAGDNKNKTILTLVEFRQAMAYGINRTDFSLATMPTCLPTFGLLSNQHIVDTETGVGYRSTEIAKQVLADFWGVSGDIGEGKLYADLDEAVDAITGYNPDLAKQKFDEAYDKAIAEGLMDEDDKIEICIGLPSATSSVYNNGYEFIVNGYTELVKGTKLENKLTFKRDDTIGDNFGGALRDNQVDMLFYVGFSGSELNPYYLMEVYCDGGNLQYDPCIDYQTVDMTVELDGTAWTTTVYNWFLIMNGTPCTITAADGTTKEYSCGSADEDPESRLQILGTFEGAIMMNYDFIPLSGDSSAQLVGQQVQYFSDEYLYGVGFGGIKYMTYNYSDAEWVEYVASQNGELDYT